MFRSSRAVRETKKNEASARHIELLEQRTLLSAVVTATLPTVQVATSASPSTVTLGNFFGDNAITAGDTTVLMQTTNGAIPIELFNSVAPLTVANFLNNYVNTGLYNGTIFHRVVKGFVDQGGGFKTDGTAIPTAGTVNNEFHLSNTVGTIAMAKLGGDPNSATDQWFINVADNSSNLDAQNGGFTVFAHVLYNGMTIANAINNLPVVDGSALNPQFAANGSPSFPVQNASGGLVPSNLAVLNNIAVVQPLTFSATSDNTNLVTPSVASDGTLTLTYGAGVTGRAHVTVTAHDLGGGTSVQTFLVDLGVTGDETSVVVGAGGHKALSLQQADGTVVTVKVGGKGSATILADGDVLNQAVQKNGTDLITGTNAIISSISTTGTNSGTTLNITTTGGKIGHINGLTTDAAVGTINAKTVNLTGSLTAGGPVKNINLHGASGGTITIPAGGSVNIKSTTAVTGESIASGSAINNITVPGWDGVSNTTSSISAPSIGTFNVKGDLANTTITLNGAGTELKNLNVSGIIGSVILNASGNLSNVAAGSMSNDRIFAGVGTLASGQALPNFPTDFVANDTINNVRVKNSFANTNISAETLGNLTLGRITTSNGGTTFGVAGHSIKAVAATDTTTGKKISLHKLTATTDSTNFEDFVVKLL